MIVHCTTWLRSASVVDGAWFATLSSHFLHWYQIYTDPRAVTHIRYTYFFLNITHIFLNFLTCWILCTYAYNCIARYRFYHCHTLRIDTERTVLILIYYAHSITTITIASVGPFLSSCPICRDNRYTNCWHCFYFTIAKLYAYNLHLV